MSEFGKRLRSMSIDLMAPQDPSFMMNGGTRSPKSMFVFGLVSDSATAPRVSRVREPEALTSHSVQTPQASTTALTDHPSVRLALNATEDKTTPSIFGAHFSIFIP